MGRVTADAAPSATQTAQTTPDAAYGGGGVPSCEQVTRDAADAAVDAGLAADAGQAAGDGDGAPGAGQVADAGDGAPGASGPSHGGPALSPEGQADAADGAAQPGDSYPAQSEGAGTSPENDATQGGATLDGDVSDGGDGAKNAEPSEGGAGQSTDISDSVRTVVDPEADWDYSPVNIEWFHQVNADGTPVDYVDWPEGTQREGVFYPYPSDSDIYFSVGISSDDAPGADRVVVRQLGITETYPGYEGVVALDDNESGTILPESQKVEDGVWSGIVKFHAIDYQKLYDGTISQTVRNVHMGMLLDADFYEDDELKSSVCHYEDEKRNPVILFWDDEADTGDTIEVYGRTDHLPIFDKYGFAVQVSAASRDYEGEGGLWWEHTFEVLEPNLHDPVIDYANETVEWRADGLYAGWYFDTYVSGREGDLTKDVIARAEVRGVPGVSDEGDISARFKLSDIDGSEEYRFKIPLSEALDSDVGEWGSPLGQNSLSLWFNYQADIVLGKFTDSYFSDLSLMPLLSKESLKATVPSRPAAPEVEAPLVFGDGEAVVSPKSDIEGAYFEHSHDGGKTWVGHTQGSWTEEAGAEILVRVAASQDDGRFASRAASVKVESAVSVDFVFEDEAGSPMGDEAAGALAADGSVGFEGAGLYATENSDRHALRAEGAPTRWVAEGGPYALPRFAQGEGAWETPGYDVARLEFEPAGGGERELLAEGDACYSYAQVPDVGKGGRVIATLAERTYRVAWAVDHESGLDYATSEGTGGALPTVQLVRFPQTVYTKIPPLENWEDGVFEGGLSPEDATDPEDISWEGYVRDPWALKSNAADPAEGSGYRDFQVAARLGNVRDLTPSAWLKAEGGTRDAASWRDADTVTFGVVYREVQGVYGLSFGLSDADHGTGWTNENGAQARRSLLTPARTGFSPRLVAPGAASSIGAGERSGSSVFSGYFFAAREGLGLDNPEYRWDAAKSVEANLEAAYGAQSRPDDPSVGEGNPDRPYPDEGNPATGDEVAATAQADLTARIEDAGVVLASSTLPALASADSLSQGASGELAFKAADLFAHDEAHGVTHDEPFASEPAIEFAGAAFTAAEGDPADWLEIDASALEGKKIDQADAAAALPATVKAGLGVGVYEGALTLTWRYADTTGAAHEGLSAAFDVSLDVRAQAAQGATYVAAAHDYAALGSAAVEELTDGGAPSAAKLADKMGLAVAEEGGAKLDPSAWRLEGVSVRDASGAVVERITGDERDAMTVTFTVRAGGETLEPSAQLRLFDTGTPWMYANDASVWLPSKDAAHAESDWSYRSWAMGETGAAAYDPDNNWRPVEVMLFDDGGLRAAGEADMGKAFELTLKAGGTAAPGEAHPSVTLVRVPTAEIPAPEQPAQDVDATTDTALAWGGVSATIPGAFGSFGYEPPVSYGVAAEGGEGAAGSLAVAEGTSADGLSPNTRYGVDAGHAENAVYEAGQRSAAATMATRPSAPAQDDFDFDYEAETVSWDVSRHEGSGEVSVSIAPLPLAGAPAEDGAQGGGRAAESVADVAAVGLDAQHATLAAVAVGVGGEDLASSGAVEVPNRAAAPVLSYEPGPDAGTFAGFDAAFVGEGGASLYQVRVDGGAWQPAALARGASGAWEYAAELGRAYEFRVGWSDGAGNACGLEGYTAAHFASAPTQAVTAEQTPLASWAVDVYEQGADGSWPRSPSRSVPFLDHAGEEVSADVAALLPAEGFHHDAGREGEALSGTVAADGSLRLAVYLARNVHEATFSYEGGVPEGAPATPDAVEALYGAPVELPAVSLEGWEFSGWRVASPAGVSASGGVVAAMPDADVALAGSWSRIGQPPAGPPSDDQPSADGQGGASAAPARLVSTGGAPAALAAALAAVACAAAAASGALAVRRARRRR